MKTLTERTPHQRCQVRYPTLWLDKYEGKLKVGQLDVTTPIDFTVEEIAERWVEVAPKADGRHKIYYTKQFALDAGCSIDCEEPGKVPCHTAGAVVINPINRTDLPKSLYMQILRLCDIKSFFFPLLTASRQGSLEGRRFRLSLVLPKGQKKWSIIADEIL